MPELAGVLGKLLVLDTTPGDSSFFYAVQMRVATWTWNINASCVRTGEL